MSDDICEATLDDTPSKRCRLPIGHDGLHRWYADDRSQSFEWG
jgi:hypothetical protein